MGRTLERWINYQWEDGENILAKGNGIDKSSGLEEHKEGWGIFWNVGYSLERNGVQS